MDSICDQCLVGHHLACEYNLSHLVRSSYKLEMEILKRARFKNIPNPEFTSLKLRSRVRFGLKEQ